MSSWYYGSLSTRVLVSCTTIFGILAVSTQTGSQNAIEERQRYCTRNGRYAIIVSEVCEYANIIPSVIGNAGIRLFEVYLCCVHGHHAVRYVLQN